MINFSEEDIEIINNISNTYINVHHVNLSSGAYYVKFCTEDEALKEILGKKIFDVVGIYCPKYTYLKEQKCIVSEDLNQLLNFKYMKELKFLKSVTLDTVINKVCQIVANKNEITRELNIMHFIDILFSNTDRHTNNYGLTIDESNNSKLVVFDNGMFLEHLDYVTKPVSSRISSLKNAKASECEAFLNTLTNEELEIILELFNRFKPENIELILNSIEIEYNFKFNSKNTLLKNYIQNYKQLFYIMYKYKTINLIKKR